LHRYALAPLVNDAKTLLAFAHSRGGALHDGIKLTHIP
jgi:hypothetical protein